MNITPKRRELLQAIADKRCKATKYSYLREVSVTLDRGEDASWPPGRWATVTAEFWKLHTAGLVELARPINGLGTVACRITEAGLAALAPTPPEETPK